MPGESFTLLLLLFVAAGCGWFVARLTVRRPPVARSKTLSPGYLRGVTFLLEDKPDKAIEIFVSLLDVDDDTIDTHFALGTLFRRRGEVDRAIRIHQNLIARPNLERVHREQALFALAEDYLGAGLLDRAEGILVKLADQSARRDDALIKLADIYERQQDWSEAIAARRRAGSNPQSERTVAHYYCELAAEAHAGNDLLAARKHLKAAQAAGVWLVRGAMMRADIALSAGDRKTALRLYRRIAEEDTSLLLEVWPRLCSALEGARGKDPVERFLRDTVARSPSSLCTVTQIALIHGATEHATVRDGVQALLERDELLRESLDQLGILPRAAAADAVDDAVLLRVMPALGVVMRAAVAYRCGDCGYTARQLYWQCPGCRQWDGLRWRPLAKDLALPGFAA